MPHDRNGVELQRGDVVKGKGYNIPHEIVGLVMKVKPGDVCNLEVSCITKSSRIYQLEGGQDYENIVMGVVEYGQCDAFEKIA